MSGIPLSMRNVVDTICSLAGAWQNRDFASTSTSPRAAFARLGSLPASPPAPSSPAGSPPPASPAQRESPSAARCSNLLVHHFLVAIEREVVAVGGDVGPSVRRSSARCAGAHARCLARSAQRASTSGRLFFACSAAPSPVRGTAPSLSSDISGVRLSSRLQPSAVTS